MKKLLWISPYVPYDGVVHAGGKTHNYYIKYLQKSAKFDIHLITLAEKEQADKIDLDRYGISYDVDVVNANIIKDIYRKIYNIRSVYDSNHELCQTILSYQYNSLKRRMRRYSVNNKPDIVIMQWTGAAFLLPYAKELFPEAKTVVIEEDVSFLGYHRKYKHEKDLRKKNKKRRLYNNLKNKEIELLNSCDIVVLNNGKDCELLKKHSINIDKMVVISPYFQNYSNVQRKSDGKTILFYGVMSREENHLAAMWFIKNVIPLLRDLDIRFEIVGSNPKEELKRLNSDKIVVRGYVDDITDCLAKCLCMVVPLKLGAGIKVKVLEGMSAGVPIITSSVGLEGIPADVGNDIICCDNPEEYGKIIRDMVYDKDMCDDISNRAKTFIKETYSIDVGLDELIEMLTRYR